MNALATLPNFLTYIGVAIACLGLFTLVYIHLTPFPEFALIRQGNTAAAMSFCGALLGYALPLASVIAHSVAISDMLIWSLIALIVQYVAHLVARGCMPELNNEIRANNTAMGLLSMALSVVFGLINAACMTY